MKPISSIPTAADQALSPVSKLCRSAAIGVACLAMGQALQAQTNIPVPNGNFASGAANWSGSGFVAGNTPEGWNAGYYGGAFPTDNYFMVTRGATAPVTQVLNDTFVEGVTYTLSVDMFGPNGYSDSTMWSLGLFARDGANADTMLNRDHWFLGPGTGYAPQTVSAGNGGNIPDDHIIARGVKNTSSVTFTATSAIAGQKIGISLAGKTQSKYTFATDPAPPEMNVWYGHYDNVTLSYTYPPGVPVITSFAAPLLIDNMLDGYSFDLTWSIANHADLTTLTLGDGSTTWNVLDVTVDGEGAYTIDPSPNQTTTYTLTANGSVVSTLVIAKPDPAIASFTAATNVIDGQPIELDWQIDHLLAPGDLDTLVLTDDRGGDPVDVKGDTDINNGFGFVEVNPTQTTTYTLTLNGDTAGSKALTIANGRVNSFTSSKSIATGPGYTTTLDWNILPGIPGTVTISDGVNDPVDVTADTVDGVGSRTFVVPSASTIFTLDLNDGDVTATRRVLRAVPGDPEAFSMVDTDIYAGESVAISWKNAPNPVAGGNWVSIYTADGMVGVQFATTWTYLNGRGGANGSWTFNLPAGQYYAVMLEDGSNYDLLQGPIYFTVHSETRPVAEPPVISSFSRVGNTSSLTWNVTPGAAYKVWASNDLIQWDIIQEETANGAGDPITVTEDLSLLPGGPPERRFYRLEYQ